MNRSDTSPSGNERPPATDASFGGARRATPTATRATTGSTTGTTTGSTTGATPDSEPGAPSGTTPSSLDRPSSSTDRSNVTRTADRAPSVGARTTILGLVGAIAAMIIVIAAVQNSASVDIEFLWWSLDAPLAVVLVAAFLIGGLLASVINAIAGHRRNTAFARRSGRVAT